MINFMSEKTEHEINLVVWFFNHCTDFGQWFEFVQDMEEGYYAQEVKEIYNRFNEMAEANNEIFEDPGDEWEYYLNRREALRNHLHIITAGGFWNADVEMKKNNKQNKEEGEER